MDKTEGHSDPVKTLGEMAAELDAHFNGTGRRTRDEINMDVIKTQSRRNAEPHQPGQKLAAEMMKRNARPTT